jgi:hypothetical protein
LTTLINPGQARGMSELVIPPEMSTVEVGEAYCAICKGPMRVAKSEVSDVEQGPSGPRVRVRMSVDMTEHWACAIAFLRGGGEA